MNRLQDKVVLLTGIGGGMGRATARLFAQEGAVVVGSDRNPDAAAETVRLLAGEGYTIDSTAPVDLADRTEVQAWVEGAVARHGRIDVLYNNASHPKFAPFAEQSEDDYRYTIRNELDVVWHVTQFAWPHLANSQGSIVMIGSGAAILGTVSLPQAAHAATKGAIVSLTRQLAAEGIPLGIRVNTVSPGVMATPPILAMFEQFGDDNPVAPIVKRSLGGKAGDPIEVAYAGLYLASAEARWVTGAHLVVDGGVNATV